MRNRIGEEKVNNFGSKMKIIKYDSYNNIDVHFPEYNWTANNKQYYDFQKGTIKCPYEPRLYNKGYVGEGNYRASKNGKHTKYYARWKHMLQRCYSENYHKKRPTYKDCEVCDEWLNFQNFADWFENNYYEVDGERMHLDKDILVKGNKIYSPDTCVFVPQRINSLFENKKLHRGSNVLGVFKRASGNYEVQCSNADGNYIYLGRYNTEEDAFKTYKSYKEKIIKQVAEEYYVKGLIPKILYDGMYKYKVEIND